MNRMPPAVLIVAALLVLGAVSHGADETFARTPEPEWLPLAPNMGDAVNVYYYPSYDLMRVRVDTDGMVRLIDESVARTPEGEPGGVFRQPETGGRPADPPDHSRHRPGRPRRAHVAGQQDPSPQLLLPFHRHHRSVPPPGLKREVFPWENNALGIIDEVLAPFEPMTIEGETVSVVLRDYVVGGLGFWKSVRSAGNVSAGGAEELLAGPITLRVNGEEALGGRGRFTDIQPHQVKYEGQARHPAVSVRTRTTTEYDGTQKVEMELAPGSEGEELHSLWLDVPIRDAMAPLWHVVTTGIRGNPAGRTPEGNGRVWDSQQHIPDHRPNWAGKLRTNFYPYYWLGAEERGLAWFADNDRNWEEFVQTLSGHAEYDTFGSEWDGGIRRAITGGIVPSYRDFAVWYAREFIRRGIGVYFDNSFPERAYDPITTSAYRLPDGRIQPSAGIWHRRDYLRRVWTLHKQYQSEAAPILMMIHMTNTHVASYMGWNHSNLDLEYHEAAVPQQKRWPAAMLRAQSLGRQTGNIPLALANVHHDRGTKEEVAFARRTRFGVLTVHEVKGRLYESHYGKPFGHLLDFGYGEEGCRVFNYWDEPYPLPVNNEQLKTLLLERDGRLMIVVCTWNDEAETVKITPDLQALDVELTQARNAETGEKLDFDGQTLTFDLEGYGVRVVRLE
jgi:hypothetical protein